MEKALVSVIQEAWIAGVSTRRVDELVQAMGMSGISKSSVSKLCKDIDERVNAFLKRPLSGEWPYLWLDATYLKVREGGRIVSVAAIIAVAVTTEGKREIVGLHIGPFRGRTLLDDFPARPRQARAQGREARDLRRPRGVEERHHPRCRRHLAALPRGAVEEVALEEDYPAAGFVRHMPTTIGRGRMANGLHRPTRSNRAVKMAAASRLRFTAAAVRKACMRMFESPRLTARARPCHVFASPW